MQNYINNIFDEYNEHRKNRNLFSIDPELFAKNKPYKSPENNNVSTLAEIFLEWYLFNSNSKKDINTFLNDEDLVDIFTESEFMDLMCGRAYLDEDIIQFVALKLPFEVSLPRLHDLNDRQSTRNDGATLIVLKQKTIEKTTELSKHKKEKKRQRAREYSKKYRETHKEYFKQYRETHREHLKELLHNSYVKNKEKNKKTQSPEKRERNKLLVKKWHAEHAEEMREYQKQYRKNNAVAISESKKKCFNKKKEHYIQKKKEYAQKNKEKLNAKQKAYHDSIKSKIESAKTICAMYVFLSDLKHNNREQFLKIYRQGQNIFINLAKTCMALQNMDINMCPLCNENCGTTIEQSCNADALSLPGAIQQIQTIANNLKQR